MTVTVYRSTDASAPVLTGSVGSLVALLDACLVNGYGTKAAAGWTKPYSTANKGAYQQNVTGANNPSGMFLYVDDTGPGAGGAREARVTGYETMSAITPTGTGQFPTSAQSSIGVGACVIRKSTTADATARAWTLIANGQTIYLFVETGDVTVPVAAYPFVFGDFKSYKTGDQYAVIIIGRLIENSNAAINDPFQIAATGNATYLLNNVTFGHFIARHWTGVGGSIKCGKTWDYTRCGVFSNQATNWGGDSATSAANQPTHAFGRNNLNQGAAAPNPCDGSLQLSPIYLNHSNGLRGYLPGLWAPLHDRPLGHNDTVTITSGPLNGKSLVAQNYIAYISNANDSGVICIETSNTWS